MTVEVAVVQFAPEAGDNRGAVTRHTNEAVRRGAKVIVFPEYSSYFVDPMDESLRMNAETLDGPFVAHLTALAAEHSVTIVAGIVEQAEGDRVSNTLVAVNANGVVATYRKQHLYDAFGQKESDWVAPGGLSAPETFTVGGIVFGLLTCYDLRFPEVTRVLADQGATAAIVPAEWVRGPLKDSAWTTLLAARAIENTMYVVGADHPPSVGVGLSSIVDPMGVTIAGVGANEGIATAVLDPAIVEKVRRVNPALELRRYAVVPGDSSVNR